MFTEILILILCVLAWRRWRIRRLVKLANELKSDIPSLPLMGHSYLFIGNNERRMKSIQLFGLESIKHGGIVGFWHANQFLISVADPETAEFVLKNCLQKDKLIDTLHLLLGNGSIFAPVPIWRPRRKILAPAFTPKNLINFMTVFNEQSKIFVNMLQNKVGKGDFSIWDHANTYTMDSVCETTLGVKIRAQNNPDQQFLLALEKSTQLIASRICQPWLHSDFIYSKTPSYRLAINNKKIVFDFINEIIENKLKTIRDRKETQTNSDTRDDGFKTFLELLIDYSGDEQGYTNVELQEETLVIVAAGTDTSAVGISFMTVMLSKHPGIQEKLYQEIIGMFDGSDKSLEPKDLLKLPYLDAFVKETLRMYPPVPGIVRTVEKDIELPSGQTIVKGCTILINIWAIHRNPKYWGDDAESFRPERFIDTPLKHPDAFMPFSSGPRGCLGFQYAMTSMKTLVIALVRRYRVLPANQTYAKSTDTPLRVKFDIMMRHVDNYMVQLELRN